LWIYEKKGGENGNIFPTTGLILALTLSLPTPRILVKKADEAKSKNCFLHALLSVGQALRNPHHQYIPQYG
jgi:hypothetical protein